MIKSTDRELLEFAAKAAGLVNPRWLEDTSWGTGIFHGENDDIYKVWNPLRDDSDALRLAVKLELLILPDPKTESVRVDWYGIGNAVEELFADCPYAAMRRAIVRAAAEIGRNMK